jgi:hypothetical protein
MANASQKQTADTTPVLLYDNAQSPEVFRLGARVVAVKKGEQGVSADAETGRPALWLTAAEAPRICTVGVSSRLAWRSVDRAFCTVARYGAANLPDDTVRGQLAQPRTYVPRSCPKSLGDVS